jgi:hypothetical protein
VQSIKSQSLLERASIKKTAAEQRERWREVGEALLEGRKDHPSNQAFGTWCLEQGFDMKPDLRADSMWLAQNWSVIGGSEDATHPTWIRKAFRMAEARKLLPADLDPEKHMAEVGIIETIMPIKGSVNREAVGE